MDALSALDKLRISLQNAATMCRPAAVTSAVANEESFDSADMEEEDPHEGVGVDERAASLDPEDFLLDDDQPWYPSARWVLGRDETVSFIAAALISHLAPLYVPFASNTALTPTEVVPMDVQKDVLMFAEDFVSDHNLTSLSVLDVKDAISAALGDRGATFLPHEYPICGEDDEGEVGTLSVFSSKFPDTEEGWAAWYAAFRAPTKEEEEEDEDDDDDDDDESCGDAEDRDDDGTASSAIDATMSGDAESLNSSVWEEGPNASPTKTPLPPPVDAPDALRGSILSCLPLDPTTGRRVSLPQLAEAVINALSTRLHEGRNARNSLVLLALLASKSPPSGGVALTPDQIKQVVVCMLLTGPLRSLRLCSEDPPPASLAAADLFAQRAAEEGTFHAMDSAAAVLAAAKEDRDLCAASTGWCLKFLFEGEAMEDVERRAQAFAQVACELVMGPFHGVTLTESSGDWSWKEHVDSPAHPAVLLHAKGYSDSFALAHGDSLASILSSLRSSLSAAGFKIIMPTSSGDDGEQSAMQNCRPWADTRPSRSAGVADAGASCVGGARPRGFREGGDIPAFRELPQMVLPAAAQERHASPDQDGSGKESACTSTGAADGGGRGGEERGEQSRAAADEDLASFPPMPVPVFGALPAPPPPLPFH